MSTSQVFSPTADSGRISAMDTIRGVALLGILLMNITSFGLSHAYFDPTVSGGAEGWDLRVWWINSMFFEGTMRGMFSMLFGAGIILFTSRATDTVQGVSVTDLYFRRITWLLLFGILHAYVLLWDGEILYAYALVGMVAFSFRVWKPKHLIIGAVVLLSFLTLLSVKDYLVANYAYQHATAAEQKQKAGQSLTAEETKAIEKWQGIVADQKPSAEKIKEDIAGRNGSYFDIVWFKASINQFMETYIMYRYFFCDVLAMMLMGMAFLKNGIFKATRTNAYYLGMVGVGYAVGLTVNYFETAHMLREHFSVMSREVTSITYDLGRLFTTIGHIGVIMLFIKSDVLPFLQRALAAVGQMAFTNYIMQTLICNTVFLGIGFGMYGKMMRHELYYVVLGVWLFQLVASPLWLRYFHYGPLEWAWRALTYWQRQPFRKGTEDAGVIRPVSAS